jgi:hypothetical protein
MPSASRLEQPRFGLENNTAVAADPSYRLRFAAAGRWWPPAAPPARASGVRRARLRERHAHERRQAVPFSPSVRRSISSRRFPRAGGRARPGKEQFAVTPARGESAPAAARAGIRRSVRTVIGRSAQHSEISRYWRADRLAALLQAQGGTAAARAFSRAPRSPRPEASADGCSPGGKLGGEIPRLYASRVRKHSAPLRR